MFLPFSTKQVESWDYMLAGKHHGKIKAMHDERGNIVTVAGPSTPVSVLGLDGATAGDKFNILKTKKKRNKLLQNVLN
jgi:translation initiation factor IF-2